MNLFDLSAFFLIGFAILAFLDGVYLHLYKFRLYAREDSVREHAVHTMRAVLFVPMLVLVLSGTSSGVLLWLGVAVLVADVVVTVADVILEPGSRAFQGGVPPYELAIHVLVTVLHVTSVALSLVARPAAAWLGTTTVHLQQAATARGLAVHGLLGGAVVIAVVHLALLHPRFRRRTQHAQWATP